MTTSDLEKTENITDYFAKFRKELATNLNSREAIPEHYYRVIPSKDSISLRVGPPVTRQPKSIPQKTVRLSTANIMILKLILKMHNMRCILYRVFLVGLHKLQFYL